MCVLRLRRPPRSTRTASPFPYTTLFHSPRRLALWQESRAVAVISLKEEEPCRNAARPRRYPWVSPRQGVPGGKVNRLLFRNPRHTSSRRELCNGQALAFTRIGASILPDSAGRLAFACAAQYGGGAPPALARRRFAQTCHSTSRLLPQIRR